MTLSAALLVALASITAPPNVILLSVDTLRADYLGCYGHPYPSSPNIDRFAKEGLLFEDCVCEVPLTNPSFSAMFTSRYPRMLGTTKNGLRLPEDLPVMTEIFKAAGYYTACVQSNWTLKRKLSRLDRGFDVYRDDFNKKRWGVMKGERDGENVTDVALELLRDRDPSKPFFFWIHYSDPHAPYDYHKEFNPEGKRPSLLDAVGRIRLKYDSEVAFTDSQIGRLLAQASLDNTIVLFTADHGESLYENSYLGHGRRIYQTNLHVPLILHGPGIAPGRSSTPACILDIAPTLLALAGLKPAEGMLGRNLRIDDGREVHTRFVETYGGAVPKLPWAKALLAHRRPMRQGVIHDGWKLILGGDGPELFNLREDPLDQRNRAAQETGLVKDLTQLLDTWNKQCPKRKAKEANLTDEDQEALRSLGYLQ